jgi:serine/threonine protein kinase
MSFPESLKKDFDVLDSTPTGRILPCYRVRERKPFGREFTLRLLPEAFCGDKGIVDGFHDFFTRFAEISNKSYIPQVHSFVGAVNGPVYVLEEFVSGISLTEFVEKKKDAANVRLDLINIISRVCEALHSAHQKDIFHLSIAPEDILIDENNPGKVKLVGFGAQLFASKGKLDYLSSESKTYIAPEVFKRGVFGPKADVYSLAVTIKELLPEFSEASDILNKALSITLKDRFASARQFAANIKERALSDPVAEPTPKVSKPTKAAKPKGGLQPILKVTTDPPGATVIVDGQEIGTTTVSGLSFPWSPGKTISVKKLGYATETVTLEGPPDNSTIQIKLKSALRLFTSPWGATVKVNGELSGTTTHKGLMIPWDKGEIVIEKSRYKTKKLSFAAPPTELELIVDLEIAEVTASANHVPNRTASPRDSKPAVGETATKDRNLLKMIARPWGAVIKVNGVRYHQTTYTDWALVPWDKGEIEIAKPGYKIKRLNFPIPPSEPYLVIELEPQSVLVSKSLQEQHTQSSYVEQPTTGSDVSLQTRLTEWASRVLDATLSGWTKLRWKLLTADSRTNFEITALIIGLWILAMILLKSLM